MHHGMANAISALNENGFRFCIVAGMTQPALPVVLVGGLHADARRETVERLLRAVPGALALHHDLATAAHSTVTRTVRDADGLLGGARVPLVNDCACCALREDIVPELVRLAEGAEGLVAPPLVVVELWDSVEPRPMAEVVARHAGGGVRLAGVVTAVDPALVLPCLASGDDLGEVGLAAAPTDRRTVGDTWARQLEYAPLLAIAEGPERAADADRALLAQLHPTARWIDVADPALPRAAVAGFDVAEAAARLHPACALLPQEAAEAGVATLVWRRRRPFHPARLYAALGTLTRAAPRSRGRFWLADRPDTLLSWDAAGGSLCVDTAGPWLAALPDAAWELVPPVRRAAAALEWHPEFGDRAQHLVFTGPGLDAAGLRELLASCLLTDAEYAAGREAWRRIDSAFDELLDPVS
jgi:G3E family GTPase